MKTITSEELNLCLTKLKRAIVKHSAQLSQNVVFFNTMSFYLYMRDLPCHGRGTVEDLLSRIEPYIPIRLSQEMFDMFLDSIVAAKNGDELNSELMTKAKAEFVFDIQLANTPEAWGIIAGTCESIREMKESRAYTMV